MKPSLTLALWLLLALPIATSSPGQDLPRSAADQRLVDEFTRATTDFTQAEPFEERPGGAATLRTTLAHPFSQPSANLPFDLETRFAEGRALFNRIWVAAPARTRLSDGLGPLFNARSCQSCHVQDGRGHPPEPGKIPEALILRLSVPGPDGTALPDPTYGFQLQSRAIDGHAPEYVLDLLYKDQPFALPDGQTVLLRRPTYGITSLGYGPLAPGLQISPRVAPPMIGLGLLEAIPAADILAHADPEDADGDGISGRANWVTSPAGQVRLGRFGLKATTPSLQDQAAAAFSADMGLSTPLLPADWGDCTIAETNCRAAPSGGDGGPEVTGPALELVTFYSRNLAVPARRGTGAPEVPQGKAAFYRIGCPACHVPKFVTARLPDQPAQSFQLIWPYSDLLLHDMGEGLADHSLEGIATGREWRTAPLWGIGLTARISGQESYLHDGRARSLTEAILWHGGEGERARDGFAALSPKDRAALLAFLRSQ